MNEYFQENKRSVFLLTALLFLLAIVLYIILVRPLLVDLSSKQEAISSKEEEIQILETRLLNIDQAKVDVEELMLEDKIPTKRELDDYILSLQQLETMTGSTIEKIEFVYDSNLEEIEDEEETTEEVTEEADGLENEDEEVEGETETEEEPVIDQEIIKEKPEDLQVMTVKITAISPDYNEFIELLETIENEKRISIVSKLHFLHPTEFETVFAEEQLKSISFEAELTTFYYVQ